MKKIFTLICALMGFVGANASTVDDLSVLQHSYVMVMDNYTGNGTGSRTKGGLFGSNHFLDVTGGSVATNKGSVDMNQLFTTDADGNINGYELVGCTAADTVGWGAKYGKYGNHLNSLRIKNAQDVFAMKVTAKSKIYFIGKSGGGSVRYPAIAKDATIKDLYTDVAATTKGPWIYCYTATDDQTLYIGSVNGDTFLSYVIVEANEAPGTPTIEVSDLQYDGSLYFKEVTCTANNLIEDGVDGGPTVCTYTLDGSTPTASSPVYTEPIKCYANQTVKFQAYMEGFVSDDMKLEGADNEGVVEFSFDAPTITADGATFTIESAYNNATNFYTLNGGAETEGSSATLTESATVVAYTKIVNGSYATFVTPTTSTDVLLLEPIKEKKTISVASGEAVVDEEATAAATDGSTVYKVENGSLSIANDKANFFIKGAEYGVVKDAAYQVPAGQEVYLRMTSATNIVFMIAEGDSVDVKAICSKNSCKGDLSDDEADHKCYIQVNKLQFGNDDVRAENGNIVTFGLTGGTYTLQKFSGTGNIYVSSIEITPVNVADGITNVNAESTVNTPAYNLAGQRVANSFKGVVIKNGKKYLNK